MKKIIIGTFIFLATPLVSYASINSNLSYGSTGAQVTELQQFLISNGYLQGSATGNFYSLTQKAVENFQSANAISPTGYVGSMTRAAINSDLSNQDNSSQVTTANDNYASVPVISSLANNGVISGKGFTTTNSVYLYNSATGQINLAFNVLNDTTIQITTQINSIATAQYNLFVVNSQGTSAPFQTSVKPPQQTGYQICSEQFTNETWDGTYSSNDKYNCVCQTGYTYNGSSCQLPQQTYTPPSVSAACQEAEQEVQTAQNQYNQFEQSSPFYDYSASANVASEIDTTVGQEFAEEGQAYATAEQSALEEERIVCQ